MEMLEARRNDILVLGAERDVWMRFRRRLFRTTCRSGSIRVSGGLQWTRPGSPTSVAPACAFCCKSQSSSKSAPDGWCCVLSRSP